MRRFALILFAAGLLAQSGITPPRIGYVRHDDGMLRPVYGVAGNFVLGRPVAHGVISAAFSGRLGLAKTAEALCAFDSDGRRLVEIPVAGGPAWFVFAPGGLEAVAFIRETSELVRWKNGRFELVADAEEAAFLADQTPSVLLADGRSILAADNELILRQADGTETRTSLSGPILDIEQMGEGWFHVRQEGRRLAVRISSDRLELYRLPELAP